VRPTAKSIRPAQSCQHRIAKPLTGLVQLVKLCAYLPRSPCWKPPVVPTVQVMDQPKKPGRKRNPDSKRSLGIERHAQPRKAFHAPPALFAALEKFISSTRPQPSESECMRTALEEFLEKRGFWGENRAV
jgi:hypothetical protein